MNMGGTDLWSVLFKVLLAIAILILTWIVAAIVKWAVGKLVTKVPALQRSGNDGQQIGESIGKIAALIVWLFGLVAVLQLFNLDQVLSPLQGLLGGIFGFLPNLIGAGFIFFIGYVFAKIAKQLVQTALNTVDLSGITSKFRSLGDRAVGVGDHPGAAPRTAQQAQPGHVQPGQPVPGQPHPGQPMPGQAHPGPGASAHGQQPGQHAGPPPASEANAKISSLAGNLVFGVIIIVVAIAALQVLGIEAISRPAQQMLELFLNAIPAIIAAVVLLAIGFAIAKFLGTLLEQILHGLGTDRAIGQLGIVPEGTSPSGVITKIVQIAIMIFFAIMAARMLGFPEITNILNEILELGGNVLFGAVIIAAGFFLASLIGKFITNSVASKVLRYSTIGLFIAMGLQYMGLADSIVNLAFGAVVVGGALAAALAFGLGGREAAAKMLGKVDVDKVAEAVNETAEDAAQEAKSSTAGGGPRAGATPPPGDPGPGASPRDGGRP